MTQTQIPAGQNVRPMQLEAELRRHTQLPLAVYGDGQGGYFVIVAGQLTAQQAQRVTQAIAAHAPLATATLTDDERTAAVQIATSGQLDAAVLTSAARQLANVINRVQRGAQPAEVKPTEGP